jgi:GNAT superfamily N-acetyltransferase
MALRFMLRCRDEVRRSAGSRHRHFATCRTAVHGLLRRVRTIRDKDGVGPRLDGSRLADVRVLSGRANDRVAVQAFLGEHGSLRVARRGELLDSLDHPAFLAWAGDLLVGVATYVVDGEACELLTLHAQNQFAGVGTALVEAVVRAARAAGCRRVWVVTTNDNVDALRFYQRRGFRLVQLRPGAVDMSRETLKPEIPPVGAHEIPLRDELELELTL